MQHKEQCLIFAAKFLTMSRLLFMLLFIPLLNACGGDNFDGEAIPQDQLSTELAFKRMADHGELEPVLEERQMIDGWQFHVSSMREGSVLGGPRTKTVFLKDRTGIAYSVSSVSSPEVIDQLAIGTYGFARGRVLSVKRDLSAGEMEAELLLSSWTEREY